MIENRLRRIIQEADGFAVGTFLMSDSATSAALMDAAGYDFLAIDRQHGVIDDAACLRLLAECGRHGTTPIVRIPANRPEDAMRALDHGALGVIAPLIDDAAGAATLAAACRFPPRGGRSFGPVRAAPIHGRSYLKAIDDSVLAIAMIETRAGLEALDDILAAPGLDAIFVGPNDLGLALGLGFTGGRTDNQPALAEAVTGIVTRARGAGIPAGIHCTDPAMARAMRGLGYRFATVGSDLGLMAQAAAASADQSRTP